MAMILLPDWLFDKIIDPENKGYLEITRRSPKTSVEWTIVRSTEDEAIAGRRKKPTHADRKRWKPEGM